MKKYILMLAVVIGTTLAAQTSNPIVVPNAGSSGQITPNTPYQPSMGSNTIEVITPSGTEVITPSGTQTIPGTENPATNYNPPSVTPAPVMPNSNENNPAGINNGTPNLSLPQNTYPGP